MKKFSWSYSALSRYETCPKQYREINLLRNVRDEYNKASSWGRDAHVMLADALRFRRMPKDKRLEPVTPVLNAIWQVKAEFFGVEEKVAFDKDWGVLDGFFHEDTWFRAVFDCIIRQEGGKRAIVIDWKTGKYSPNMTQVYLYAKSAFALWPSVEKTRVMLVWTEKGEIQAETVTEEQVNTWWENDMSRRVQKLEAAVISDEFPARRSGLCKKWCPVTADLCPYGR